MSLLPPEVHTALSQLLRALSTPDNTVRSQAEDQLNNEWVQNKPDVLLMGLAEQIGGAEDTLVSPPRTSGEGSRPAKHKGKKYRPKEGSKETTYMGLAIPP